MPVRFTATERTRCRLQILDESRELARTDRGNTTRRCWYQSMELEANNRISSSPTEPQVFPHQAEARQGEEAEPPHPPVDSSPNGQHHPVRYTIPRSMIDMQSPTSTKERGERGIAFSTQAAVQRCIWVANMQTTATTRSGGTGARPVSVSRCLAQTNVSRVACSSPLYQPSSPLRHRRPDYKMLARPAIQHERTWVQGRTLFLKGRHGDRDIRRRAGIIIMDF